MQMTKKITSIVLAVLMVVSMMSVMAVTASAAVIASDSNGNDYEDLNSAYYYAAEGATVTLNTDVSDQYLYFAEPAKNMTFDLGGHTLTLSGYYGTGIYVYPDSNITLKNGTIRFTSTESSNQSSIAVYENATLNLDKTLSIEVVNSPNAIYVMDGATLNTAANITTNGGAAITTNGNDTSGSVINITGGKIKNTNGIAIYNPGKSAITISGSTTAITGDTAVYTKSGTVTVKGGTLNGTGDAAEYTYKASGAKATGDALVIDNCGYPGGAPVVNITGGTFNSTNAKAVASYTKDDTFTAVKPAITGGSYTPALAEDVADIDAKFEITLANGKVSYTNSFNLSQPDGTTVKFLKDYTSTSCPNCGSTMSENSAVTLDLNGHTLNVNTTVKRDYCLLVAHGNTLTVKNGTIEMAPTSAIKSNGIRVEPNSTLNIESTATVKAHNGVSAVTVLGTATLNTAGKLSADDSFAIAGNGSTGNGGYTVNVTGGTVTATNAPAIYHPNTGTLNISGGTITGDTAVYVKSGTTNITGGTLKAVGAAAEYTYNGNGANSTGDALVIDNAGYPGGTPAVNISGGTFNSANGEGISSYPADDVVEPVISSDITYSYETVKGVKTYYKSAFPNAMSSSGTYTLYKDVNKSTRVNTGILASDVTLDLNGHTFTSTATDYGILLSRAGSASAPKSFVLKNGTFNAKQGIDVINSYNDLTVENVTMNVTDNFAITTNGKYTANNITVKDSDITSGSIAIYKPSNGTLTFENSDVTGTVAVYVKSGEVSIDGGTFTGTGAKADYTYNGSGAVPTGDAVVIDNCGYPGGAPSIAITSGTFVSQNADAVGSYGYNGNDALTEFISGGSFSNEVPVEQCAKGFEPAPLDPATGKYTVQVKENPLDELLENAADISDGNQFGLNNDYNVGAILGAQSKDRAAVDAAETSESKQESGSDIRFVAALSTDMIQRADDYGFVLAKVGTDKNTANTVFDNLKANFGNGEKTISAKNTYNNICGDERYGDPTDISTDYKYITCAVNGLDDSSKVAARFYVVIDGKTYYAKYAKDNYAGNFRGITAGLSDLTN